MFNIKGFYGGQSNLKMSRVIFAAGLLFTLTVLVLYSFGFFQKERAFTRTNGSYHIPLEPLNPDVSLRGTATVQSTGDTLTIRLSIRNTRSETRYNSHLHVGECSVGAGGGVQLEPVVGTGEDTAINRSLIPLDRLDLARPHLIMVHQPGGKHALCGNLPTMTRFVESTGSQE